ncbi:hypothetical protein BGW36DRAFT_397307 [Talaromyces proteolyticus]|uniref:BZIP domain-containing protein n=1 Tax=Talaromyces proteolyticus TaxID=1131652 RepID=A0AAD4KPS6_9EURO|nr:uncharacterized protein BGW36DRAFT_397307 [Talaromyces proteolyticus]KAH8697642.1 hypothetical protein BGW36DRAFT_397307 [Talaromyces proteolyticus]
MEKTTTNTPRRTQDGARRVRKRSLTNARREQNRLNQRAYRQRQRAVQRLDGLRSSGSSAQSPEQGRQPIYQLADDTAIARDVDDASKNRLVTPYLYPELIWEGRGTNDSSFEDDIIPQNQLSSSPVNFVFTAQSNSQLADEDDYIHAILSDWPPAACHSFSGTNSSIFCGLENLESLEPHINSIPSGSSTSDETINHQEQNALSPKVTKISLLQENPSITSLPEDIHPLSVTSPSQSGARSELPPDDNQGNRDIQDEMFTVEGFDLNKATPSPSQLPDPWRECIHFSRSHILLACVHNARSMGFDPTLSQMLCPHPAFMDLIPFPVFRARAITLLAMQPHLINLQELKNDLAIENGLSYWSTASNEARTPMVGATQGQPWDMHSWEVAPWFLCKWRTLFGGEDGEVWNQSLWWQRARGLVTNAYTH